MTTPLTIDVDGTSMQIDSGTTLDQLVERLGKDPAKVTTAVNGQFVARAQRSKTALAQADRIVLFQPIVGG